ncbi:MAG: hypothetical protein M3322_03840 [Actinomycetota bacterium]|nr:hypothetical protein [Actinomycetota bacterium]
MTGDGPICPTAPPLDVLVDITVSWVTAPRTAPLPGCARPEELEPMRAALEAER